MRVQDKLILVTGAGSGIGRALTLNLVNKGAKVAALDIHAEGLEETKTNAGEKGKNISLHVLNITDKAAVENLPQQIISQHGNIDGVINNAGIIQPFVKVNDLDYAAIDRVMQVNFFGMLYLTKTFLPLLLKRPEAHLVNISSMGGFLPVPGQSVYGASKAAVKLLTEGLYAELLNTNVRVTVVFPGATKTNITENSGLKMPELGKDSATQNFPMLSAEAAAEIIVRGIEKNQAQIFVGKDSRMMNLFYRLNPVWATKLIAKQMQALLK